jgi:hypothetical protein
VVRNPPGRRSSRPSHGSYSSPSYCPSLGPSGRLGTSDGDTSVQEEAPPGPCPPPGRAWTGPRRQPPARQCTNEATIFACWYSCPREFPLGNAHKTLLLGSLNSNPVHSRDSCAVNISRRIPPYRCFVFPGQVHRSGRSLRSGRPFLMAASNSGRCHLPRLRGLLIAVINRCYKPNSHTHRAPGTGSDTQQ